MASSASPRRWSRPSASTARWSTCCSDGRSSSRTWRPRSERSRAASAPSSRATACWCARTVRSTADRAARRRSSSCCRTRSTRCPRQSRPRTRPRPPPPRSSSTSTTSSPTPVTPSLARAAPRRRRRPRCARTSRTAHGCGGAWWRSAASCGWPTPCSPKPTPTPSRTTRKRRSSANAPPSRSSTRGSRGCAIARRPWVWSATAPATGSRRLLPRSPPPRASDPPRATARSRWTRRSAAAASGWPNGAIRRSSSARSSKTSS